MGGLVGVVCGGAGGADGGGGGSAGVGGEDVGVAGSEGGCGGGVAGVCGGAGGGEFAGDVPADALDGGGGGVGDGVAGGAVSGDVQPALRGELRVLVSGALRLHRGDAGQAGGAGDRVVDGVDGGGGVHPGAWGGAGAGELFSAVGGGVEGGGAAGVVYQDGDCDSGGVAGDQGGVAE